MPDPVVIDTHVFNRLVLDVGEYREVYETLVAQCDRILYTDQIVEEYVRMAPRAGITPTLILTQVIPTLRRLGKWIETGNRRTNVGPEQDRRFISAALSGEAKYLISNDPGLRTRPVERVLERQHIRVLFPREYLSIYRRI